MHAQVAHAVARMHAPSPPLQAAHPRRHDARADGACKRSSKQCQGRVPLLCRCHARVVLTGRRAWRHDSSLLRNDGLQSSYIAWPACVNARGPLETHRRAPWCYTMKLHAKRPDQPKERLCRTPRGHFTSKSAWWFSRKNLSMPSAAAAEHCSPASRDALRQHSSQTRHCTGGVRQVKAPQHWSAKGHQHSVGQRAASAGLKMPEHASPTGLTGEEGKT